MEGDGRLTFAVEIPGPGVEPVQRAGCDGLAGAGEAWLGVPQAAIGRRGNGCLEYGVAWKRADRIPAVWGFNVQARGASLPNVC